MVFVSRCAGSELSWSSSPLETPTPFALKLRPYRYNNKTYRIDDIDWDKSPNSKFKLKNGEETSFVDYYDKVRQVHFIYLFNRLPVQFF